MVSPYFFPNNMGFVLPCHFERMGQHDQCTETIKSIHFQYQVVLFLSSILINKARVLLASTWSIYRGLGILTSISINKTWVQLWGLVSGLDGMTWLILNYIYIYINHNHFFRFSYPFFFLAFKAIKHQTLPLKSSFPVRPMQSEK